MFGVVWHTHVLCKVNGVWCRLAHSCSVVQGKWCLGVIWHTRVLCKVNGVLVVWHTHVPCKVNGVLCYLAHSSSVQGKWCLVSSGTLMFHAR